MTTTEPIRCIWHACAWTFFSTNFVSSSQRFRRVFSQQNGGNLPLVTLSIFLSRKVIFVSFLLISVAMVHWFQRFCCGKCTQVFFFFSTKFSRVNPSISGRNSWSFTISFSFKQKMAARFSQRPMDGHWPVPAPKFINKFHFRQQPKHNDPLDVHWIFLACHVSKRWPKHFYEINCRVSSYAKFQPARGPR